MQEVIECLALFGCGAFFGAALYISLVQHPAMLAAGADVGCRFFPPMYKRAAPMQITLAVIGFIGGLAAAVADTSVVWLVGALLLIAVIPITLIAIKPINDILLNTDTPPKPSEAEALLKRWGRRHWWRTGVSGVAFVLYLAAII